MFASKIVSESRFHRLAVGSLAALTVATWLLGLGLLASGIGG